MRDINTYIEEGFYQNTGTREYIEAINTFNKIKKFIETNINIKNKVSVSLHKYDTLWMEFRNLFIKIPENYGFIIVSSSIFKLNYSYSAYIRQNNIKMLDNTFHTNSDRVIDSKGDNISINLPYSSWREKFINTGLVDLYNRIYNGSIGEIKDIYLIKFSEEQKNLEVVN